MSFRSNQPYDDLPGLPPKADIESRSILRACIIARAALAEMRTAGRLIPNPDVLINAIPLFEAQASSEIENIVTTTDRLFRLANEIDATADPSTREALRYRTALREGFESLSRKPLSTGTAIEICRAIKGVALDIRSTPGTALLNHASGAIVYTPPEGQGRLRDLLADWERYAHADDDTDPLIKMAVLHYQFEAIHPFTDGNGRTGRVLNVLYLIERGLLDTPTLYLSRYIASHKNDYYGLLLEVTTASAWEKWILYMLEAVRDTAQWTNGKIAAIRAMLDETAATMQKRVPKIYSRELAEIIFVQPYCRIENLIEAGIAKRQTASEYLKALAALGLVEETKSGRDKVFINPRFMNLLAGNTPVS